MRLGWRGTNTLFFCCSGLQFICDGHTNAFTPLLLHDLGLSSEQVSVWTGILVVVMTGMAFPLTPFWGVLAERFSRRNIILRTYVVYAGALLITAWAPSIWFLVPARALMGLGAGTGGVMVAVQALLVPRRNLGMAIALVQSAMPIAQSLGPPLGALAIPYIGLRGLFIVDASAMVVCAVATFVLMPEPEIAAKPGSVLRRTAEVLKTAWDLEPVRWNFICAFAQRGATGIVDAYLPVRITQVATDPAPAIGWILGIYGALTTVATWFVGRIVERSNEPTIYTRGVFFATLLTAGMAAVSNLWLLGFIAALRSVPVAFSNTVLHSHNAKVIPRAHQTPVLSLSPVPRNLGGLVFPLLAAMTASLGPGIPLALGAVSYGLATLAGMRLKRTTSAFNPPPRGLEPPAPRPGEDSSS